jgi:carboxypeptidase PM20D1
MMLHLKGKNPAKSAVVLMAHSDVVPASGNWRYPPFSGDIIEGRIWGRGATDAKGVLGTIMQAVENLISEDFVPDCDVYIVSSDDEETMGCGAENMRDILIKRGVKLRLVLDEGGAVVPSPMPGLCGNYAMLGIVEKGSANVRFIARSAGGHANCPPPNSPIARLSAFVCEMEKNPPFKKKIDAAMRRMLNDLAPDMKFPIRLVMSNLWLFSPLLLIAMPKLSPVAAAFLSTTCAFTMSEGSNVANTLPEIASLTANLRFSMHQTMQPSLEAVKKVADRYGLDMEVLCACDSSPCVDTQSEEYRYVSGIVRDTFPEAGLAAYIIIGGTDARHFAKTCPVTIRFAPLLLSSKQRESAHGMDENIDAAALGRAVKFYENLIRGL